MRLTLEDFPSPLKEELKSSILMLSPILAGLSWSFVFPFKDRFGQLNNKYWFGLRRDTLSGPVPLIRSTFWCFGFDQRTPLSLRTRKVDNTTIIVRNGFEHTVRFVSSSRFGFCCDDLTITIREEVLYDWS